MKYLFVALTLLSTACATSGVHDRANSVTADEMKKFNAPVQGLVESEVKITDCSKNYSKAKTQWAWKQAVTAATACFKNKDYSKVEELAQDIAQKETASPWGPYFLSLMAM